VDIKDDLTNTTLENTAFWMATKEGVVYVFEIFVVDKMGLIDQFVKCETVLTCIFDVQINASMNIQDTISPQVGFVRPWDKMVVRVDNLRRKMVYDKGSAHGVVKKMILKIRMRRLNVQRGGFHMGWQLECVPRLENFPGYDFWFLIFDVSNDHVAIVSH